jgi:hypothetical protein
VPIALRINVFIVNIDTSARVRNNQSLKTFDLQECKAEYPDLKLEAEDNLNFHNDTLYVMRKDGHYDIIYNSKCIKFDLKSLFDSDK